MKKLQSVWQKLFFGVRARILVWYIVLMACSTLVSILVIRQILLVRLVERIEQSLIQEVQEFQQLRNGRDPTTGQPFGDNIAALFDLSLSRNIPDEYEILLTLLDGKLYKASSKTLPEPLQPDSPLIKSWARSKHPMQGEVVTSIGIVFYRVQPVIVNGNPRGVFVIAYPLAQAWQAQNDAVSIVAKVTIIVFLVASILAWIAAGRALKPLRSLTETARAITGSDLSRRIPVQGTDEIAELTATFNDMLARLQATFASQRNFINDAGHELRTPIAIIRGHLEVMGDDPQEQQETFALLFDELDRMNRFVNDLLLLAKAEQPDFLNPAAVDTDLLTMELYAKARALAERNWQLVIKKSGCIEIDRQRLTQAIMNLADNASQHTEQDDTIEIGSDIDDQSARFWVRDTGEGIAITEQERIFQRFVRGSKHSRADGTGLGLAIVRAIAEAHHGRIELVSQPGLGSTFTIILPVTS